ncbi:M15 family metallopeptidase [Nocardioides sp.]|jgi:hypothetical protein|uniref:M15 family metallopeptidase n=1 Tax=Nocardioides sp. TaxID=35761 RepID=UPI0031FE473C|nr:hypothetical protein [Nocardioides sp.]
MGLRRALGSAGLVGALVLAAACGGPSSGNGPGPAPSSTVASGSTPPSTPAQTETATPVADPAHAVDPPGRRTDRLRSPDLLVNSRSALSNDLIDRIARLRGVTRVEKLSLAEVPIENRTITVAAVDPATYRLYTPLASADFQEEWDRVAGGELAITKDLSKRLPTDDEGYLRLGSSAQAQRIHVGAFAPQILNAVDAVVNDKWGAELGIESGNALLISTGINSPDAAQKAIERIAGKASVQRLDVVARSGIDPGVVQTAYVVGSIADAVGTFRYTVLGGGHIAPESSWVATHITTQTVPILGAVTCNRLLFPQLRAALEEVVAQGLTDKIHPSEYAGCYYPRFIAGTTSLSNHSFGLALDLNTPGNQRGTVGEMDRGVVAIFKKWGFTWGGDWRYTDPMHFEMNALVNPR